MASSTLTSSPVTFDGPALFASRMTMGLFCLSLSLGWITRFEPAPTDIFFALGFVPLVFCRQLVFPRRLLGFHLAAFGFLCANAASLLLARYRPAAFRAILLNLYMLSLLYGYLALIGNSMLSWERFCFMLFGGAVVSAIICLLAYRRYIPPGFVFHSHHLQRLEGFFKSPNVFGPFMISAGLLGLSSCLERNRGQLVGFAGVTLVITMGILSLSRGAWVNLAVAVAVAVSVLIMMGDSAKSRARILLWLVTLPPLILVGGYKIADSFGITQHVTKRFGLQDYDNDRFSNQSWAVGVALDHPLGIGPGHYVGRTHFEHSEFELATHNVYLKVLVENGIGGLVCFAAMLGFFVWRMLQGIISFPNRRLAFTAGLAIVCGILVNSIVIDTLHWRHLFIVMGATLGLLAKQEGDVPFRDARHLNA